MEEAIGGGDRVKKSKSVAVEKRTEMRSVGCGRSDVKRGLTGVVRSRKRRKKRTETGVVRSRKRRKKRRSKPVGGGIDVRGMTSSGGR